MSKIDENLIKQKSKALEHLINAKKSQNLDINDSVLEKIYDLFSYNSTVRNINIPNEINKILENKD